MKLFCHLPENQYHKEPHVADLQKAFEKEVNTAEKFTQELYLQLSPHTATWGLTYFEKELGLSTDTAKTVEERREIVLAKERGRGTSTKAMIQGVAESFYQGQVEVKEYAEEYLFELIFINYVGVPDYIQNLTKILLEIRPAHLDFKYTIREVRIGPLYIGGYCTIPLMLTVGAINDN